MNLKEEILDCLRDNNYTVNDIICAEIYDDHYSNKNGREDVLTISLNSDISEKNKKIEGVGGYNYNDGYGSQVLYGFIWLSDGSWFSRGEYDGSEWFVHNKTPEIPKHLIK